MVSDLLCSISIQTIVKSLNPCFNGIWSRTGLVLAHTPSSWAVLILVLMEYVIMALKQYRL